MNLWQRFVSRMQPTVFLGSAGLIVALTLYSGLFTPHAKQSFDHVQSFLADKFDWFFILVASGVLLFVFILPLTRLGRIKLGKDEDEPEFTLLGWFAMLFAAGMGIGLVFWAVAEPMLHWDSPPAGLAPGVEPRSDESLELAMRLTFYHWGIHPWAIYVILGIGIGVMHFRYDLPLAPRSILYPLFRDRIYGPLGHVVDIVCTVGTLVGVAASLGLGSLQINAGLGRLFADVEMARSVQLGVIGVITAVALVSVVSGIHAGIRRLSELNLTLMTLLLLFVFVVGPTAYLPTFFSNSLGTYLQNLVDTSLWVQSGDTIRAQLDSEASSGQTKLDVGTTAAEEFHRRVGVNGAVKIRGPAPAGGTARTETAAIASIDRSAGTITLESKLSNTYARGSRVQPHDWQQRWTIGYWGWWLAWAPFVGIFVARVSHGRTVREFIFGVVFAPTLASFVWLAVIGGTGIYLQREGQADIAAFITQHEHGAAKAMHLMLEELPWGKITGLVATLLTTVFFVTSSDSGSLVDDMVTSGGHPNPPVAQRVFWAVSEGAVAAALVWTDGVDALYTSAIAIGFLMAILVVFCCFSIVQALQVDRASGPARGNGRKGGEGRRAQASPTTPSH